MNTGYSLAEEAPSGRSVPTRLMYGDNYKSYWFGVYNRTLDLLRFAIDEAV